MELPDYYSLPPFLPVRKKGKIIYLKQIMLVEISPCNVSQNGSSSSVSVYTTLPPSSNTLGILETFSESRVALEHNRA